MISWYFKELTTTQVPCTPGNSAGKKGIPMTTGEKSPCWDLYVLGLSSFSLTIQLDHFGMITDQLVYDHLSADIQIREIRKGQVNVACNK